jgi:CRISPR-associated endonuclease/helicase Cas3
MDFDHGFADDFEVLTGFPPFPWQETLYRELTQGRFPQGVVLPTGLGKTLSMAVWLLSLAKNPRDVPRRLVYVVNRRTVVDQATLEAEKLRDRLRNHRVREQLAALCAIDKAEPLAISTLRGEFADNREWSRDPTRPAIVAGTVDMVGSRLLFSGYGAGFKTRPLFGGFLGQDVLLIHDEAHLEPAFQHLIEQIAERQLRDGDIKPIRVVALSATPRGAKSEALSLTAADLADAIVVKRVNAKKELNLHEVGSVKEVANRLLELTGRYRDSSHAVLVFVRTVEAVEQVKAGLVKAKIDPEAITTLTGTMRGLERDQQLDPRRESGDPVFARFLKPAGNDDAPWLTVPRTGTVYLISTSAGEVGVDLSADNLVCDLTTFESMAQRFGRVNRFGSTDSQIDVVHETPPAESDLTTYDGRRWATLTLLRLLDGDASPFALGRIDAAVRERAFGPAPVTRPLSDILFDRWTLTTILKPPPERPEVPDYLHGMPTEAQPPETRVAWREEVERIRDLLDRYDPAELLEDYPLKPHELLRDRTDRIVRKLELLAKKENNGSKPVWIVRSDGTVTPLQLSEVTQKTLDLRYCTVLLPPSVGGLDSGNFDPNATSSGDEDVADKWFLAGRPRRARVWDKTESPPGMRLVRSIVVMQEDEVPEAEEELHKVWRWYALPRSADDEGSASATRIVSWQQHTDGVEKAAGRIAAASVGPDLQRAIIHAARCHDLGKRRGLWQRGIGNHDYPAEIWGKSANRGTGFRHRYRHEFGSLIEAESDSALLGEPDEVRELALHLIAAHHGRARPHFPSEEVFDPEREQSIAEKVAAAVPSRFARLQRRYGRWGLAYLESLLRAADYLASSENS